MHVLEKDRWSVTLRGHSGVYISKNKRADVKAGKYTVDTLTIWIEAAISIQLFKYRIIGNP